MQHTKRLAFAVEMRSPTSGDEDDEQYGSEAQVETQEKMGSELSHKYQGPGNPPELTPSPLSKI